MWQEYFRFIKLRPGRVVTTLFGELDFSNPNIPLHKIQTLYENDFPYLTPTQKGLEELYGIKGDRSLELGVSETPPNPQPLTPNTQSLPTAPATKDQNPKTKTQRLKTKSQKPKAKS
jgi:hypothetical protein